MVYHEMLSVQTRERIHLADISRFIGDIVKKCGLRSGIVSLCSQHTTAGITINENADPDVCRDLAWKLSQMVPRDDAYRHGEGNSDSHVKASIVGHSVQVPVQDGRLVLGTWQAIYLCEFDGPRNRRVSVTAIGE